MDVKIDYELLVQLCKEKDFVFGSECMDVYLPRLKQKERESKLNKLL